MPSARAAGPDALGALLSAHCGRIGAEGGAILRVAAGGRVDIVAVHPSPDKAPEPPDWLTEALTSASAALDADTPTTRPLHGPDQLYGQQARRHVVMAPLTGSDGGRGLAVFAKETADPAAFAAQVARADVQVSSLELFAAHLAARGPRRAAPRLEPAMATLAAVNDTDRFLAAAMAFCNEIASRWRCERVSLGFLKGHSVELKAMSHTEKFSRKTQAVQLIEAAMEECLDQDVEVLSPAGGDADFVDRAARELSTHGGRMAVLSVPLRHAGGVAAAATLERVEDKPFAAAEVESLRLTCELCAPRLIDLRRRDRWIGAKAAAASGRALASLIGPRHTWLKLVLILLAAGGAYAGLATGEYRIEAPFVLEATTRQVLPAPFDGEIERVTVDVGDKVTAGQVLVKLKTLPLERQINAARAELFESNKQADSARADKRWAEAQMAAAKARQLTEQIQLLTERVEQASIKALIDGTVVSGELEQFVGASVEKGQVLLEIAPIGGLRAEMDVPEDQIADLLAAARAGPVRGSLAAASYPDEKVEFTVGRIYPMAEEVDDEVVFKVRGLLDRRLPWMRPGMAGVAHVRLGRRRLAWLWSRRIVNRLRLWMWL